jgi:hypothetical protein
MASVARLVIAEPIDTPRGAIGEELKDPVSSDSPQHCPHRYPKPLVVPSHGMKALPRGEDAGMCRGLVLQDHIPLARGRVAMGFEAVRNEPSHHLNCHVVAQRNPTLARGPVG